MLVAQAVRNVLSRTACRRLRVNILFRTACGNFTFQAITIRRSPPDVIPRSRVLGARRRLPIGIGTRVFRHIRRGHARLSPGVSRIGTARTARRVHAAELIALVNDRLGPRLSPRHFAHRPLAGITIANIVAGPQIPPIAAQVLPVRAKIRAVVPKVLLISTNIGPVTLDVALILRAITLGGVIVAAQILPVRTKIRAVSRKILPIGTNVNLVALDVALVLRAITVGTAVAVGVDRYLLVRWGALSRSGPASLNRCSGPASWNRGGPRRRSGAIVAAQVLLVRTKVSPIPRKILLINTNVGLVTFDVALVLRAITLGGVIVAAQILPVRTKIRAVSRKILLIGTNVSLVALDVALVLRTITVGRAVGVARVAGAGAGVAGASAGAGVAGAVDRYLLVHRGALSCSGPASLNRCSGHASWSCGASRRRSAAIVAAQVLLVRTKVGTVSRKILLIGTNVSLVTFDVALVLRAITLVGTAIGAGLLIALTRRSIGYVIVGVGLRQRRS